MVHLVLWGLAAFFGLGAAALIIEALLVKKPEPRLPSAPETDHDLARYAAAALKKGLQINKGFRDYGGHGLIYADGVFIYGASMDGLISKPSETENLFASDPARIEFKSEQEFIDWLINRINQHGPCLPMSDPDFRCRLELAARHGLSDTPIPANPITCV
jgi:hypothetical protein